MFGKLINAIKNIGSVEETVVIPPEKYIIRDGKLIFEYELETERISRRVQKQRQEEEEANRQKQLLKKVQKAVRRGEYAQCGTRKQQIETERSMNEYHTKQARRPHPTTDTYSYQLVPGMSGSHRILKVNNRTNTREFGATIHEPNAEVYRMSGDMIMVERNDGHLAGYNSGSSEICDMILEKTYELDRREGKIS